LTNLENLGP